MGVRILVGIRDGTRPGACLFCSTSEWAFGPMFEDYDAAESFLEWLRANGHKDPRTYRDDVLRDIHHEWWKERQAVIDNGDGKGIRPPAEVMRSREERNEAFKAAVEKAAKEGL